MIVQSTDTTPSIDIEVYDDSGLPVTGLVAATMPTINYSVGGSNAKTSITLSDLAAETTAWSSGGLKERGAGVYRLDLPTAAISAAGRRVCVFGYATGKNLVAPVIDTGPVSANLSQILATTLTETSAGNLAMAFKKLLDVSSPVFTTASINQTGDLFSKMVIQTGTASAGTTSSITLQTSLGANNVCKGFLVVITGGTGVGQSRVITSYTDSTRVALVSWNWIAIPDATSQYAIMAFQNPGINSNTHVFASIESIRSTGVSESVSGRFAAAWNRFFDVATPVHTCANVDQSGDLYSKLVIATGTATAASSTTITLQNALGFDSAAQDCAIAIIGGTGAGQLRPIQSYTNATKVVVTGGSWNVTPDATSQYAILNLPGIQRATVSGNRLPLVALQAILTTALSESTAGNLTSAFKKFFDVAPASTNLTTASVNQTGDAFGAIGTSGVGLTNLGDARIASIDTRTGKFVFDGSNNVKSTPQTAVLLTPGSGTGQVNLSGGKVQATIAAGDIATGAIDANAIKADAVAEIQSGLATATTVGQIKAKSDLIPANPAAVGSQMDLIDSPNTTARTAMALAFWGVDFNSVMSLPTSIGNWLMGGINQLWGGVQVVQERTNRLPDTPASTTNIAAVGEVTSQVAIDAGGIAEAVWTADDRTLTGRLDVDISGIPPYAIVVPQAVASLSQEPLVITIIRGDTLRVSLPSVGNITTQLKSIFSVKATVNDTDQQSILQIIGGTGLVRLNGAEVMSPDVASLSVRDAENGSLDLEIDASVTAEMAVNDFVWDLQIQSPTGIQTPLMGTLNVVADVTRAVT